MMVVGNEGLAGSVGLAVVAGSVEEVAKIAREVVEVGDCQKGCRG